MKTSPTRLTVALIVLLFSLSVSSFLLSPSDFETQQANSLNHNNNYANLNAQEFHGEAAATTGYTYQYSNLNSAGAMPGEEERPWAGSSPSLQSFPFSAATQTASSHVVSSVHSQLTALMPAIEALLGAKLLHDETAGTVTLMAPDSTPEVTQSAKSLSPDEVLAPLRAELASLQAKLETVLAAKISRDETTGAVTLVYGNTQSAAREAETQAAPAQAKVQAAKVNSREVLHAKIQSSDPYELSNDLRDYLKEQRRTMNLKSELSDFIPDASTQSKGATLARGNGLNADRDTTTVQSAQTTNEASTLAATDNQASGSTSNGFMADASPQQRTSTIVVIVVAAVGLPILVAVAAAVVLSTIVLKKKKEALHEQKQDEMKLIEKAYSDCQE